jgi:heat shock protein HtpX
MDLHQGQPLAPEQVPHLAAALAGLSRRAALPSVPRLYRLGGAGINALAAGSRSHSAIGLSDDCLRLLPARELRAVLAHELSHIAAGDTRLLTVTHLVSYLTRGTAQFILLASGVLLMASGSALLAPWQVVLFVLAIPAAASLHAALAREREFAADHNAVRLTGDRIGLVAALERIENWEQPESPPLLRSHPLPGQRIARLESRRSALAGPAADPFYGCAGPLGGRIATLEITTLESAGTGSRLRRSGGLTMPPEISILSPSSGVMCSSTRSLRGMNTR